MFSTTVFGSGINDVSDMQGMGLLASDDDERTIDEEVVVALLTVAGTSVGKEKIGVLLLGGEKIGTLFLGKEKTGVLLLLLGEENIGALLLLLLGEEKFGALLSCGRILGEEEEGGRMIGNFIVSRDRFSSCSSINSTKMSP